MGMDALSSQAVKSLVEHVLPRLQETLGELNSLPEAERMSSPELEKFLSETIDMLNLVHTWTGQGGDAIQSDEELDDSEASDLLAEAGDSLDDENLGDGADDGDGDEAAMLAQMESDEPLGDPVAEGGGGDEEMDDADAAAMLANMDDSGGDEEMNDADAAAMLANMDDGGSGDEEMNDADAAAMLANMDGDGGGDEGEMSDADAAAMLANMDGEGGDGEMSDADAAAMLANMDGEGGDGEMSDDEAAKMLANMDGDGGDGEMSDDEAAKMLAQMDGGGDDGEMSDDEAAKMLAQMDGGGDAAPASTAEEEDSAEDEAAALLKQLGGGDFEEDDGDDPPPLNLGGAEASSAPAAAAPASAPAASSGGEPPPEDEIDEWIANDFQTDPDMVNDFISNSDEIMDGLDDQLLKLESDPQNKDIIEEIFRGAHTLKGAAGMFGFSGLERVMHRMENLFDLVRKDKLTPTSDIMDVMFEGLDLVKVLLTAVKDGKPCGATTGRIVRDLGLVAEGKPVPKAAGQAAAPEESASSAEAAPAAAPAPAAGGGGGAPPAEQKGASKEKKKESSTIRVDLNRLDALVNLVGELVIDRTRFVSIEEELRSNYPNVKLSGNISETVQLFGRHMNEIQDIIMKVRMVPIGNAFNKYPRIIRDLAKQLGKKIELHISGESAELDKTLVEQIGDPLVHLIRNSCDHGVELPDVRKAGGKPPKGNIWLSAQQEGNHIVITIEDDGKGIPADIIRRKGIEKGLIKEEDKLTNREIFNLIFEPGFSTAETVSNISGRGVGMDVVKKQIMKLKGQLEVDSQEGSGTTVTIRLPLTLAIVQSLLVRAKGEIFAIPLGTVIESIWISPQDIQKVGEAEVIKLRDRVLPLMHLEDELNLEHKQGSMVGFINEEREKEKVGARKRKQEKLFVVVVGQQDRPFGILVDQLLNQQEMVIKSMGRLMKQIPCVAGGAVLGNGEVVLVLDIAELQDSFSAKSRGVAA